MVVDFEKKLHELALVLVKKGVVLEKGQSIVLQSAVPAAQFAREVAKVAYECGAKEVYTIWTDDEIDKYKYENESIETLSKIYPEDGKVVLAHALDNCCFITIRVPDPDVFSHIPTDVMAAVLKRNSIVNQQASAMRMNGTCKWTSMAIPSKAWARKVYPDLPEDEAYDKLWNEFFDICRIEVGKGVQNWQDHTDDLTSRANYLTSKNLKKLVYENERGTHLTVKLPENHLWVGGTLMSKGGTPFVPNIPTEEVATAPHAYGVDGTLVATRPLSHNGQIIDKFKFTLKDGKIVDFDAEVGYDHLKSIIETDDYSCRLGEVALVPVDSPISKKHTVFYNTLFDENASCHFAIGRGYPVVIKDNNKLNDEDIEKLGLNTRCLIHVDFMVGSEDLTVKGYDADNNEYLIFKNGNWAF